MVGVMSCLREKLREGSQISGDCQTEIQNCPAFNCAHDARALCPGITERVQIAACLKEHVSQLSKECIYAVNKHKEADNIVTAKEQVKQPIQATETSDAQTPADKTSSDSQLPNNAQAQPKTVASPASPHQQQQQNTDAAPVKAVAAIEEQTNAAELEPIPVDQQTQRSLDDTKPGWAFRRVSVVATLIIGAGLFLAVGAIALLCYWRNSESRNNKPQVVPIIECPPTSLSIPIAVQPASKAEAKRN
jgi:hypothetical protein